MVAVSVIIPAYNSGAFIGDAIGSVFAQTYRDYEIIVVDDGSSDNTREIIERAAVRHPGTVRYFRKDNRGPGAARNLGIRHAQGRYIAFLDADDVWLSNKLEKQVAALEASPDAGLVYCDNYFVDRERRILPERGRRRGLPRGNITLWFFYRYFMFTSAVLARRSCIEVAGTFREDIFVGEDYHYFMRLSYGCLVELVEEKLLEKRVLDESLSNQDYLLNARNDLLLMTDFIRENPEYYRRNRDIIARRLAAYHFSLGYRWLRDGRNALSLYYLAQSLRYRTRLKTLKCMAIALIPYDFVRFLRGRISGKGYEYPRREQEQEEEQP